MAIVNMKKMHLLGLKKEQGKILSTLQKTGVVEIIDIVEDINESGDEVQDSQIHQELTKELTYLETKLSNLKFGIDFLKPYVKSINPLIHGKPSIKKDELSEILSNEVKVLETLQAVFDLDKRISRLKVEESKLQGQMEMLSPWRSLDIPLDQLGSTQKTVFLTTTMPRKSREELEKKLDEEGLLAEITTLGESQDDVYALVIYHKNHGEELQSLFKEFSVNTQDFPRLNGTPTEIIKKDQKRLTDIEKERENIKDESKKLADQRLYFEILYDYYSVERDRKSALQNVADTDKTFSVQAWLPEQYEDLVKSEVLKVTDTVYLEFRPPSEDEEMPVLLSNSKLVEPFEVITELYSLPDPRGIDPNIYMAPFYFIFFGMMLSDAGYGIIMSLITGFALWKFKLADSGKKFVSMLFLCGLSTVLWGAVFGGWFGDLIRVKPLWINPLDNPLSVLILSFIMGIIQIYTGIILNAYKNVRAGHTADALMDQGLWLVLLTGLLMFVKPELATIGKYMALFGAVGLVLTQGRSQKGILKKLTSGILSLYDITGYLSDVLSYSRLLALGLTTGVIASVINTMAKTVSGSIVGYVAMALIIIGGHVFNLVINVLGAYVHSSRLQYIEFFSKFYDSGGRAFNPLRVKTTYVELEDM
ncbi:MAG TPA: V-type ATP synthase subunit I [Thermoanaerobacterales bacterium]|jgi:V/A-type H+-transporting ATPase subunit I|nr:V-type ATP synthase subunit I [Thermoanaerobacterales bacterium]